MARADVQVLKTTRRPVNLSLDEDVLREARALTSNLSATVERLLAAFVEQERARQREADEALGQVIAALNTFHAEHGYLSDEFPSL